MPSPLVYIITLNWNRCEDTLATLASLNELTYPYKRILLVDNGSTDDTVLKVAEQYPTVEILLNKENLGYAAGNNAGLRYALDHGADYVLLINNDTQIHPQALDFMLEVTSPDIGMIAPKIFYMSEPQRIWEVGGMLHPLTWESTDSARGELDGARWQQVQERDYFTGCTLLLSRPFLERVGFFDERFFMYYEDSDLCLRARKANYKLLLVPDAKVWHKVAVSSGGSNSPNERYWMARSSVLFFYKHIRGLRWLIVFPYRLGSAIKTVTHLVWHKRLTAARAYLKGLRDGFTDVQRK